MSKCGVAPTLIVFWPKVFLELGPTETIFPRFGRSRRVQELQLRQPAEFQDFQEFQGQRLQGAGYVGDSRRLPCEASKRARGTGHKGVASSKGVGGASNSCFFPSRDDVCVLFP